MIHGGDQQVFDLLSERGKQALSECSGMRQMSSMPSKDFEKAGEASTRMLGVAGSSNLRPERHAHSHQTEETRAEGAKHRAFDGRKAHHREHAQGIKIWRELTRLLSIVGKACTQQLDGLTPNSLHPTNLSHVQAG